MLLWVNAVLEYRKCGPWVLKFNFLHLGKNPGSNYLREKCSIRDSTHGMHQMHSTWEDATDGKFARKHGKTRRCTAPLSNIMLVITDQEHTVKVRLLCTQIHWLNSHLPGELGSAGCLVWDMCKATVQLDVVPRIICSTQRASPVRYYCRPWPLLPSRDEHGPGPVQGGPWAGPSSGGPHFCKFSKQ